MRLDLLGTLDNSLGGTSNLTGVTKMDEVTSFLSPVDPAGIDTSGRSAVLWSNQSLCANGKSIG